MSRTRVRVRWGRVATLVVAVALSIGALAAQAGAGAPERPGPARTYVVQPGETVWDVAERVAGPSADPRPVVDALIARNRLTNAIVRPGQVLVLPSE